MGEYTCREGRQTEWVKECRFFRLADCLEGRIKLAHSSRRVARLSAGAAIPANVKPSVLPSTGWSEAIRAAHHLN
jgi:hypothetical protein